MNDVALLTNGTVPFGIAPIQPPPQPDSTGQAGAGASPGPVAIAPAPTVGSRPFTFRGDWGPGSHEFGVSFANDLWDGTPASDRNLYIDSATYNGGQVANTVALLTDSTARFGSAAFAQPPASSATASKAVPTSSVVGTGGPMVPSTPSSPGQVAPGAVMPILSNPDPAISPPSNPSTSVTLPDNLVPGVPTPSYPGQGGPGVPPTVGIGTDSVTLNLSEDADAGDAQFVFTVDGQQVGSPQSVTALHGKDPSEAFTFLGDWGTGTHQFGVAFVNGFADGSTGANRHLYLDSASYNTNLVANATEVASGTPVTFGTAAIAGPPGQPVGMSAPAPHQGSTAAGSVGTPSNPAQASGHTIATIDAQTLAFGSGTQSMSFASPQNLTITGGSGADTVRATAGTNTFIAGAGSMDITGGSGASDFVLRAGGGKLTIEDFLSSKGDVLTVDKALQPNLKQASDGHGGALLTFGAQQGSIDLIGYSATAQPHITFA